MDVISDLVSLNVKEAENWLAAWRPEIQILYLRPFFIFQPPNGASMDQLLKSRLGSVRLGFVVSQTFDGGSRLDHPPGPARQTVGGSACESNTPSPVKDDRRF